MDKRNKLGELLRLYELLGGHFFLVRAWALAVILIACIPPQYDWHAYCLALLMPILLISLALSIWRVAGDGTDFAYHTEENENPKSHE